MLFGYIKENIICVTFFAGFLVKIKQFSNSKNIINLSPVTIVNIIFVIQCLIKIKTIIM